MYIIYIYICITINYNISTRKEAPPGAVRRSWSRCSARRAAPPPSGNHVQKWRDMRHIYIYIYVYICIYIYIYIYIYLYKSIIRK